MKQPGKFILASLIVAIFVLPLIAAATMNDFFKSTATNVLGFKEDMAWNDSNIIVVQLMIWLILFVAFADILELMFSNVTRWIIGFGLAVIAANVGVTTQLNIFLFEATAGLGSFAVAATIAITFVCFFAAHFGLGWAVSWVRRAREMRMLREGTTNVKGGIRGLKAIAKELER